MKSTEPAIVVRKPSVGKRVMRWMPETPDVSLRQFSSRPRPSGETMPMPVTATGAPDAAVLAAIDRLHQRHALASHRAPRRHHYLIDRSRGNPRLDRRVGVDRREDRAPFQARNREYEIGRKGRLEAMTEGSSGAAHGGLDARVGETAEEIALLARDRAPPAGTAQHGDAIPAQPGRDAVELASRRRSRRARPAVRAVVEHGREPRQPLYAARLGVLARFQH